MATGQLCFSQRYRCTMCLAEKPTKWVRLTACQIISKSTSALSSRAIQLIKTKTTYRTREFKTKGRNNDSISVSCAAIVSAASLISPMATVLRLSYLFLHWTLTPDDDCFKQSKCTAVHGFAPKKTTLSPARWWRPEATEITCQSWKSRRKTII